MNQTHARMNILTRRDGFQVYFCQYISSFVSEAKRRLTDVVGVLTRARCSHT